MIVRTGGRGHMLTGVVESVIFKGVHYEMMVSTQRSPGRCSPLNTGLWGRRSA